MNRRLAMTDAANARHQNMIPNVWLLGAGVVLATCNAGELKRFERTELHMGSKFVILLYAPDVELANRAFDAAFARIAALDACLSDYSSDSELSRLSNSAPTPDPLPLSNDLWDILTRAQQISEQSQGAFDITVGPLTKLWRRARRQRQMPPEEGLREARAAVGYQSLVLDPAARTARLTKPHMRLDLGGIGQGFAVDQAMLELEKLGIHQAIINASGDLAASGPPPGQAGWAVGIAPLEPDAAPSVFGALAHQAISTSGDAFQFVEIDHVRYSHIVDPRTGLGLTQRSSVSVLARNCTAADALATAASVLGPVDGLQLLEQLPDTEGLVVVAENDRVVTRQTSGFAKWVTAKPVTVPEAAGETHE
ncbi:MAG: FAD:protein FMN transferase [Pirellulaceae bacterium]